LIVEGVLQQFDGRLNAIGDQWNFNGTGSLIALPDRVFVPLSAPDVMTVIGCVIAEIYFPVHFGSE
jgi:hypothetical protein